MASLALIVTLIFLSLIIIGPFSYIISCFEWVPKIIKYLLSLFCIGVGLWALFIPVPLFRVLGFVDMVIGLRIIVDSSEKKTQA